MERFFAEQMDFIYFFYGFAYVLLAAVCFVMSKANRAELPWNWLGFFALNHGIGEWLNIFTGINGENRLLTGLQQVITGLSFILLFEFGRRSLRQYQRGPRSWVIAPLIMLVGLMSLYYGLESASRYVLCLTGGLMSGLGMYLAAGKAKNGGRRWLTAGSAALGLYAVFEGILVAKGPYFPANFVNDTMFLAAFGFPVELFRGINAIAAVISVWSYYQLSSESEVKVHNIEIKTKHVYLTSLTLTFVLAIGWVMTDYLGKQTLKDIRNQGSNNVRVLTVEFKNETMRGEAALKDLAKLPLLVEPLLAPDRKNLDEANAFLARLKKRLDLLDCVLIKPSGTVIAASNWDQIDSFVGNNYGFRRYFRQAMAGQMGHEFAKGVTSNKRGHYISYPVKDRSGQIIGVFVLKKDVDHMEQTLAQFPYAFFVDQDGIVFMSNKKEMLFKSLWHIGPDLRDRVAASRRYWPVDFKPSLPNQVFDGQMTKYDKGTYLVTRSPLDEDGWSIIILSDTKFIRSHRLLGIGMTFLLCLLTVLSFIYFQMGRESAVEIALALKRYSLLSKNARDIILFVRGDGRIIEANDSALEAYGYNRAELQSAEIGLICSHNSLDMIRNAGESGIQFETAHCRKNGSNFPVEVSAKSVKLGDEQVILATIRDISDRKEAEEKLAKTHETLNAIIETSPLAIVTLDPKCNITSWNPAAARTFGWTAQEAVGRFNPTVPDGREPQFQMMMDYVIGGGVTTGWEYKGKRKDGRLIDVSLSWAPINAGGGMIVGVVGVIEDITARKLAERELRKAKEEAEAANRAKSLFLANMSHEIRTPMNGISGMTDLVLATDLTREQREYLELVRSSADSLLGIINDILDFSKIEAGKVELDEVAFDLREAVGKTVMPLKVTAAKKGLTVDCRLGDDVPQTLRGDPLRLGQVLTNLVGNAVKFTEKGQVTIEVTTKKQSNLPAGMVKLHFAVQDTGSGIPEGRTAELFKIFTQLDGSTTKRYEGTGLGLAISKRIVELMGGTIGVTSTAGGGSTFYFDIVLAVSTRNLETDSSEEGRTCREVAAGAAQGGAPKVLLVEDNPINQKLIRILLEKRGYLGVLAPDGRKALEILAENKVDVILMDIQLPDMDGLAVTGALRNGEAGPLNARTPVIGLTAYAMEEDRAKCLEQGMDGYVSKPVRSQQLFGAIESALAGSRQNGLDEEAN